MEAPVAIVGAGPVGLALALDLATRGVPSLLLDDGNGAATGSRAICWSKRTLDIFHRLGVGEAVAAEGVTWRVGRVFHGDRELYSFDLQPEPGHRMPAFVNLPQSTLEAILVAAVERRSDLIDLCWRHRVTGLQQTAEDVALTVATPDGDATIHAPYIVAADGARSTVRGLLGLAMRGEAFDDRFLIADVRMDADFPTERRFWFAPIFHPGQSALLHRQPDNVFRIDLQLEPDADPELERRPERVAPRIRAVVGDRPFELVWVSVYSFGCRRLDRFVHGRVIFAGDSAHIVSPFGARGGNGGAQDADNLGWKLAALMAGEAGPGLLDSYDAERGPAADANILASARATRFMSPAGPSARRYRDAVLDLAASRPALRPLVNPGRLSTPFAYGGSPLTTAPDDGSLADLAGVAAPDAPVTPPDGSDGWLLDRLGDGFVLLGLGDGPFPAIAGLRPLRVVAADAPFTAEGDVQTLRDRDGLVERRYGGAAAVLVRPDQHVAAAFLRPTHASVEGALRRAQGFLE